MGSFFFYVTGHGFGHASRIAAVLRALLRQSPEASIHVRTQAPSWFFQEISEKIECSTASIDVGMMQKDAFNIDFEASLLAHEAFCAEWDSHLHRELRFLEQKKPGLIIGDVPALAFAAAHEVGIPSLAIANFSWDWILEPYAERDARWQPIAEHYRNAYAKANQLLRLPLCGAMPAFKKTVDVPLLAPSTTETARETRTRLQIEAADTRKLILVSFGGLKSQTIHFSEDVSFDGYLFIGFGPKPDGLRADWIELPHPSPIPHANLVAACDVVLTKPGYGIAAEALANATPWLYVPRADFREAEVLIPTVKRMGRCAALPLGDFRCGRWKPHLDSILDRTEKRAPIASDGDRRIAEILLGEIGE